MINFSNTNTLQAATPLVSDLPTDKQSGKQKSQHPVSRNPLEKQLLQALNEPQFLNGTITNAHVEQYLENPGYAQVRSDYENQLLTLPGMVAHARNTMVVSQQISQLRAAHPELDENGFQNLLGDKLTGILMGLKHDRQLDLSHYQVKNNHKNGYAKYLLYSSRHAQLPYCLQLFVFSPRQTRETRQAAGPQAGLSKLVNTVRGQRTKLHNHIASCAGSVLQGTLEEALYTPVEGFRKNSPLAREVGRRLRETGSVEGFDDNDLHTVHRLENIGKDTAITVHYYREMDGVETETDKASSLRQVSAEMAGKANVANLYRAVKAHKPADPVRN